MDMEVYYNSETCLDTESTETLFILQDLAFSVMYSLRFCGLYYHEERLSTYLLCAENRISRKF